MSLMQKILGYTSAVTPIDEATMAALEEEVRTMTGEDADHPIEGPRQLTKEQFKYLQEKYGMSRPSSSEDPKDE